jgi:hypothetical protein
MDPEYPKNAFASIKKYHFSGLICCPGSLNKDPTIWLDGARIPQKYICKYLKISLFRPALLARGSQ